MDIDRKLLAEAVGNAYKCISPDYGRCCYSIEMPDGTSVSLVLNEAYGEVPGVEEDCGVVSDVGDEYIIHVQGSLGDCVIWLLEKGWQGVIR